MAKIKIPTARGLRSRIPMSTGLAGKLGANTASKPRPNPLYGSRAWTNLVASIITERGRRCENCGTENGRIDADHVVEIKDGGAELDAANIRLLCRRCHGLKTQKAKRDRILSW